MPVTRTVAQLMHNITVKENKSIEEHPQFHNTLQNITYEEQNKLAEDYIRDYHKLQFFYNLEDSIIGSKYKASFFSSYSMLLFFWNIILNYFITIIVMTNL